METRCWVIYTLCLACTQIQAPRTKAGVSMHPVVGTDSLGSTTLSSPYQLGGCGNPPKIQVPSRSQGQPQDSGLRPAGLALLAHLLPIFVQFCPPSCPLSVLQHEDIRSDSPGTAGWCSEVACVFPCRCLWPSVTHPHAVVQLHWAFSVTGAPRCPPAPCPQPGQLSSGPILHRFL